MKTHCKVLVITVSAIAAAGCEPPKTTYDLPPAVPAVATAKPVRPTPPANLARPEVVAPRPAPARM